MPKVELKNVKYAAFASEETSCFEATVYIDGVKKGVVSNDGKGGADRYDPWRLEGELALIAKDLPAIDISYLHTEPAGTRMMAQTAETMIGELLQDAIIEKSLKRAFKSKMLYTRTDKAGLYESGKMDAAMLGRVINTAATKPEIGKVLNVLPMAEAVSIYRAAAMGR